MNKLYWLGGAWVVLWLAGCQHVVTPVEPHAAGVVPSDMGSEPLLGKSYHADMDAQLADPEDEQRGYGNTKMNGARDSVAINTYNNPTAPTTTPQASSPASSR